VGETLIIGLSHSPECVHANECDAFAAPLFQQLSNGNYDWPVSVLRLTDVDAYLAEHRTARKRAQRSRNLGYTFRRIERCDHVDAIYAINTSMPERQGRPMSATYRERPAFEPLPFYPCPRHRIDTWGVFAGDVLVAYLVLYLSGELVLVSQILGHADHLASDVMYLLVVEALQRLPLPATVFYNRHDSGTQGLRYFKARLGFAPERVAWAA
jgi:hypothetical protein